MASKNNMKQRVLTNDAWPLGDDRVNHGKLAWEQAVRENAQIYAAGKYLNGRFG